MMRSITLIGTLGFSITLGSYLTVRQQDAVAQTEIAQPLDVSSGLKEPLSLTAGSETLVSLSRSGGSGFFWRARAENPDVATITYMDTSIEKKRSEMVGAGERDIFKIQSLRAGSTNMRFELGRAGGSPVKLQTISVQVLAQ